LRINVTLDELDTATDQLLRAIQETLEAVADPAATDSSRPTPLDPDGLIWTHFGRLPAHRLTNGLREAMLQNMHPELAAGVE
jgi:uncharacterized protein (DUF2236 family)